MCIKKAECVDWVLTFIAIGFHLFQSSLQTAFFNLVYSDFVVLALFLLRDSWSLAVSDVCMLAPLIHPN